MSLLRIELLDDCNLSSGRPFNSYLKSNVFLDRHGLPYIPAWIVKGQLCRIAREMGDKVDKKQCSALAGDGLVMDDAQVAGSESMRQAIMDSRMDYVRNPQHVIAYEPFSRIVTQVDTLGECYLRVLRKGLILEAYFECDDILRGALADCIEAFDAIVTDHPVPVFVSVDWHQPKPQMHSRPITCDFSGQRCRVFYDLHILSRTAIVSPINESAETGTCIPGHQIQRALLRRSDLSLSADADVRDITCSYAYIGVKGERGLPVPASYSTKKTDTTELRDRNSAGRRADDCDQLKGIGALYIDNPNAESVLGVEVRHEHGSMTLPGDESGVSKRFSAISAYQTFKGFFEGSSDQMKLLCEAFARDGYIRVGDYFDEGFGNAYIEVSAAKSITPTEPYPVDEFTLLLVSPTITHLPDGLYEASARLVLSEVENLLGGAKLEIVRNSQTTYQYVQRQDAWGELEPIEYAMAAGSIYRLKAQEGKKVDIAPILGTTFIGERNDKGFGEALVMPAVDHYYRKLSKSDFPEEEFGFKIKVEPNSGRMLMRELLSKNTRVIAEKIARSDAKEYLEGTFEKKTLKALRSSCEEGFDEAEAFESYFEALKKSCLLMLRRG